VTGTASSGAADGGPKRVWLVAVLFGLVSSAVLATIVILATRSSTTEADPRPTVAIVGDSITERGESALRKTLSDDWRLSIDGRSGYTVAEQIPAARALGEQAPTQVIVNLGTNDVMKGHDLSQSAADLAEVVAAFPAATCIHLVTVNEGIELGGRSFADRSAELNRSIAELAAADPRIDVVDWSAAVAAYEAGDQADGPILTDTVHPSPRGQLALAARYAEALASCPAPVRP
jgi:lysophospholipase L1-like esterase